MVNGVLVAEVRPAAEAIRVQSVQAAVTDRLVNVATPLTALTVVVPPSVALPVLPARLTVTGPLNAGATLPWSSTAWTTGRGTRGVFA
jgi:hypothetical protein